jgi:hypothetical protein
VRAAVRYHQFNQLKMTAQRHFSRGACSYEDLDMNAAGRAQGITIAKERTTHGRWFWTFTPKAGTMAKLALCPVPEMFAKFAKFAKFAIFDPALEYPTRIHRQAPRSRSTSDRDFSTPHPALSVR